MVRGKELLGRENSAELTSTAGTAGLFKLCVLVELPHEYSQKGRVPPRLQRECVRIQMTKILTLALMTECVRRAMSSLSGHADTAAKEALSFVSTCTRNDELKPN